MGLAAALHTLLNFEDSAEAVFDKHDIRVHQLLNRRCHHLHGFGATVVTGSHCFE